MASAKALASPILSAVSVGKRIEGPSAPTDTQPMLRRDGNVLEALGTGYFLKLTVEPFRPSRNPPFLWALMRPGAPECRASIIRQTQRNAEKANVIAPASWPREGIRPRAPLQRTPQDARIWSHGATASTLDSESSDRGSNPRRTSALPAPSATPSEHALSKHMPRRGRMRRWSARSGHPLATRCWGKSRDPACGLIHSSGVSARP